MLHTDNSCLPHLIVALTVHGHLKGDTREAGPGREGEGQWRENVGSKAVNRVAWRNIISSPILHTKTRKLKDDDEVEQHLS